MQLSGENFSKLYCELYDSLTFSKERNMKTMDKIGKCCDGIGGVCTGIGSYFCPVNSTMANCPYPKAEPLRNEIKELKQELETLRCYHEVEMALLRDSFSYLVEIAEDPHTTTETEQEVALGLARSAAHGDELDFAKIEDLANEKGLDIVAVIVNGLKKGT